MGRGWPCRESDGSSNWVWVTRALAAGRSQEVGSPGVVPRKRRPWWAARLALVVSGLALLAGSATAQASEGTAIAAWGSDGHYELGTRYRKGEEPSPVPAIGLTGIKQVVAAGQSSYALLSNGTVMAWGSNQQNELGIGEKEAGLLADPRPVLLKEKPGKWTEQSSYPALTGVTEVAASYDAFTHAMAIVNDSEHEGEVVTWGASEYSERGNGETGYFRVWKENTHTHQREGKNPPNEYPRSYAMFVPNLKHIVAVATGANDDFALQEVGGETTLYAWGENRDGRLGIGTYDGEECEEHGYGEYKGAIPGQDCVPTPQEVKLPKGVKVTAISAGAYAAYAVLSNGEVMAWGEDEWGELGTKAPAHEGSIPSRSDVPLYVCKVGATLPCGSTEYLQGIKSVAAGSLDALALTEGGEVVGWGDNRYGQLTGESSGACGYKKEAKKQCQLVPKVVTGVGDATAIAAGGNYNFVLSGGNAYGFGDGEWGQLGIGEEAQEALGKCEKTPCSRVPLKVEGLAPVGGIAASHGEPNEAHVLAYVESGPGPKPQITATPEFGMIKVTWNVFKHETLEFQLGWQLATKWEGGTGEEGTEKEIPREEETTKEREEKEKLKEEEAKKEEEEEEAKETKGKIQGPETCENREKPCEETAPNPGEELEPKSYEVSIGVLKKKGTTKQYVESGSIKFQSVTPLEP